MRDASVSDPAHVTPVARQALPWWEMRRWTEAVPWLPAVLLAATLSARLAVSPGLVGVWPVRWDALVWGSSATAARTLLLGWLWHRFSGRIPQLAGRMTVGGILAAVASSPMTWWLHHISPDQTVAVWVCARVYAYRIGADRMSEALARESGWELFLSYRPRRGLMGRGAWLLLWTARTAMLTSVLLAWHIDARTSGLTGSLLPITAGLCVSLLFAVELLRPFDLKPLTTALWDGAAPPVLGLDERGVLAAGWAQHVAGLQRSRRAATEQALQATRQLQTVLQRWRDHRATLRQDATALQDATQQLAGVASEAMRWPQKTEEMERHLQQVRETIRRLDAAAQTEGAATARQLTSASQRVQAAHQHQDLVQHSVEDLRRATSAAQATVAEARDAFRRAQARLIATYVQLEPARAMHAAVDDQVSTSLQDLLIATEALGRADVLLTQAIRRSAALLAHPPTLDDAHHTPPPSDGDRRRMDRDLAPLLDALRVTLRELHGATQHAHHRILGSVTAIGTAADRTANAATHAPTLTDPPRAPSLPPEPIGDTSA